MALTSPLNKHFSTLELCLHIADPEASMPGVSKLGVSNTQLARQHAWAKTMFSVW